MDGARVGLEPGDEVLAVDGRDVRDLDPRGVHGALAGEVGTPVTLTVARRGRVERLTVVRKPYRKLGVPSASPARRERAAAQPELARAKAVRRGGCEGAAQSASPSKTRGKFSRRLSGVKSALRRWNSGKTS
jgi:membrane-associated protease RseP (regulator of RpoE activity)